MPGSEEITREILGNVPNWLVIAFYALTAVACALAVAGFVRRSGLHRRGRSDAADDERPVVAVSATSSRWRSVMGYLILHRQLRRDPFAGTAHLLTFYGFVILFWGTCLVFLEHSTPLHFFYGTFYQVSSLIVDLGGVAFLLGLGMFLWRRHIGHKSAILRQWWVAALAWLLTAIGVTGFLLEGARIAGDLPAFERWSVVGYALALGLREAGLDGEGLLQLHRALWGLHALLCVAFFALLPWKFFGHIVYGVISWSKRSTRPLSQLRASPVDASPGAVMWRDLTVTELLQADACTTCGRCDSACPANAAQKPLQPRNVVLAVRAAMDAGPDASPQSWISDETLWSCTTCSACNEVCPVGIDVYGKIVELRRARIESGAVPDAAEELFDSIAVRQNPFGRPNSQRLDWAHGLDVPVADENESIELLYWIGCAGSFDPDGQSVSRSMIKVLLHLGINFRVLGCRERCTGDPARRLGEEGLFREQAAANIETLRRHDVRRILTHCPHCMNTFRNEYPQLAGEQPWKVIHHTEFLAELTSQRRLPLTVFNKEEQRVTFHDPCYLGRGNGVVEAPRAALRAVVDSPLVEMPRHGAGSFCCGAGGGAMWLDIPGQDRVENLRAREAAATGATTVVTGCPFCKVMLRSGLEMSMPQSPRVRDVAELFAEQL